MLDCSKANRGLHWQPLTDLETALVWTVDWYRRQRCGEDARELCREQIDLFLRERGPLPRLNWKTEERSLWTPPRPDRNVAAAATVRRR